MNTDEIPGVLSGCSLSPSRLDAFLQYVRDIKHTDDLQILFCIFNQEDGFKFLDIFSGRSIKVPKRSEILKMVEYVTIYCYIKERGYNEAIVYEASRKFNKRVASVVRIYEKVKSILEKGKTDERET